MVFDRYLFKSLLIATVFMTVTLAVIIFLTQSLRFLELVIESGASSLSFWVLTALAMPRFFEIVIPIALMAATLFTYNRLAMDSEMIVMRAAGYSPLRLSRPALVLCAGVTAFLLFVTFWLAPVSLSRMQEMRQIIKAQFSTLLIKEGVFNAFGDDLTVYVEKRTREGELEGLLIHDTSDKWEHPITVIARRGVLIFSDEGQQVLVYDGSRQEFNPATGALNRLDFERYSIDLPEGKDVRVRWAEPEERTFFSLLSPDLSEQRDRENTREFILEAHKRVISPFLAPAFTIMALCFLLLGAHNRRGQSVRVFLAVLSGVVIQGLYLFAFNLSERSAAGLFLMYALVALPIVAGLFLLSGMSEGLRKSAYLRKAMQS